MMGVGPSRFERLSIMSMPVMNIRPMHMIVNCRFVGVFVIVWPTNRFRVAMIVT